MHRGFVFSIRIGDLRPNEFILMTCRACKVARRVPPWMLYAIAPPTIPIKTLEHRMLCRNCGRRGDMDWCIYLVESPMQEVLKGD